MKRIKVGFLPLYLDLYDKTCLYMRPRIEAFYKTVREKLRNNGLELIDAGICKLKQDFYNAVDSFETQEVSAILTLHLAYSPSLVCIDALKKTDLPIIVLDITETYAFNASTENEEVMYNHGIHGVQDMCNLLLRNGKKFEIIAGHFDNPGVMSRAISACRSAQLAYNLKHTRVGLIGEPFDGMGDFRVPFEELENLGIKPVFYDFTQGETQIASITAEELAREKETDHQYFDFDGALDDGVYERSAKVCLAIRKWIEQENLNAFSINFLATEGSNPGLPIMPFVECSKAMARGIGYAGEGDVLTAALVGSLASVYEEVTFTEMFCPDWQGGSVFLSHMGEYNYAISSSKPKLIEKDFPFTSAENPTVAYSTFKSGEAVFVNIAPMAGGQYRLIISKGEVIDIQGENKLAASVNGWFKPGCDLPAFLESYSRAGGTHHAALVYCNCIAELKVFAAFAGFDCAVI